MYMNNEKGENLEEQTSLPNVQYMNDEKGENLEKQMSLPNVYE